MTLRQLNSVGVVGAGIVGLAVARQVAIQYPGVRIAVFEKEDHVAAHQSGHNSGVVHAGVYYRPGSLKARLCRQGSALLREFCQEHDVLYRELGKLIVATDHSQLPALASIEDRARGNSVPGVRRLGREELVSLEPFVTGVSAVHSPHTAVVDYIGICMALAREVERTGGRVFLNAPVTSVSELRSGVQLLAGGEAHVYDQVFICAGLQSDHLARAVGGLGESRILPFRGEYYELRADARHLIGGLVYPVPDPRYPFLGVHFTRDVKDHVHVGPNAVLALALEGYRISDLSVRDMLGFARWPGAWRLAARHWRHGLKELTGSLSKRVYLARARSYVPDLRLDDLVRAGAGVRAQAVDRHGALLDDFVLERVGRVLLTRNAPSPAATSSLAIAEHIVTAAAGVF